MTDGLLQVAIDWKHVFASAKEAVDAQDHVRALELLREAESLAQRLGEDDERLAETLERIGFVHQSQGRLAEAETVYRRALAITEKHLLGLLLKEQIRSQLARLLEENGRSPEAAAFQNIPLPKVFHDPDKWKLEQKSQAHKLMSSIKSLRLGKAEPTVIQPLMEELLAHIENTSAPESMEIATAFETMADFIEWEEMNAAIKRGERPGSTPARDKANQYYRKALHITAENFGQDSMNVVEVMRKLSFAEHGSNLSKALMAKANSIEKGGGFESLHANLARGIVSKLTRQQPPPDMPLAEADNVLNEFFQTPLKGGNQPFVNLQLSEEQITKQLVSLAEKAAILAEESEKDESYPLQTIWILGQLSDLYRYLGDIPRAKAVLERKMAIIAGKWGEGHIMMVETMEKYNQL
jgi:tetratricopeptide (TPR) repeat protein